ncbi:TssN family type VI secretion system protein [Cellulophaga baltica]|uniref:TssN family type VI secretion system protein n=1 Tax=Cellulophaga TaxID=104264 RepID=UPI001C07CF97|nr:MULTISPECIES: TssN family type VI secretion system protein [Cellulophaga]MBU2997477.1 TssN family type VI secretion system protein [Cellulophaga baltica]MDO6768874.1 TssN family type VI secretion system protein [Cellulophaga sp. 1_MG-2023]
MIQRYLKTLISFEALMPFMFIVVFTVMVLTFFSAKTPGFKKHRKKFYIYLLAGILVMGIFTCIVYNLKQTSTLLRYFSMLTFSFILGMLHVYFVRYFFDKFELENKFKELLVAIITSLALVVPIIMIAAFFEDLEFLGYYFLITATFSIPTAFYALFNYSISIPVKLYSKWYYPLGNKYEAPKHYELNNMIVLNFMFYKNTKETHLTSFKAKAPKDMDFGRLFFFFINDYNSKKTTTKIELMEDSGDPHGWYFQTKPQWFSASKHINSTLTVEQNNLNDGDTVVCQRI